MERNRNRDNSVLIFENTEINYSLLEQIRNSIIVLYHSLTEADDCIDYDLSYDKFPFWNYLTFREQLESFTNKNELISDWYYYVDLIHQGSLIYILSMCLERLEDYGCSLHGDNYYLCLQELKKLTPKDSDEERLLGCVLLALEKGLEYMETQKPYDTNFLNSEFLWIIKRYVREYFQRKLDDCTILGNIVED